MSNLKIHKAKYTNLKDSGFSNQDSGFSQSKLIVSNQSSFKQSKSQNEKVKSEKITRLIFVLSKECFSDKDILITGYQISMLEIPDFFRTTDSWILATESLLLTSSY